MTFSRAMNEIDIQHYDTQHNGRVSFMLSVANKPFKRSAVMLNVIMLSVVMLSVVMLSAAMLSVLAPYTIDI